MKDVLFLILTVLVVIVVFVSPAGTLDTTQLSLPTGARARLGEGVLTGHFAYSPDGTQLAVVSSIGIWLYDTRTYQEVTALDWNMDYDVRSIVFSPDGRTLAGIVKDRRPRSALHLWDTMTGKHKRRLTGHIGSINNIAFPSRRKNSSS